MEEENAQDAVLWIRSLPSTSSEGTRQDAASTANPTDLAERISFMGLWNVVKQLVAPDPLAAQIWNCDPLVVVDEDDVVAFAGRTRIECQPLADGRFNLSSENGRDGWLPELVEAERIATPEMVQLEAMAEYDVLTRGKRRGAAFLGKDPDGNEFTWYINSAADAYLTGHSEAEENEEPPADPDDPVPAPPTSAS